MSAFIYCEKRTKEITKLFEILNFNYENVQIVTKDFDKVQTLFVSTYSICIMYLNEELQSEIVSLRHHVDYLDATNMINKNIISQVRELRNIFYKDNTAYKQATVAVFDLDDTIINRHDELVDNYIIRYINNIKNLFKYVVLWSHGIDEHVNKFTSALEHEYGIVFDFSIKRDKYFTGQINKGAGLVLKLLNNKYGVTELTASILIDDLKTNYTRDYLFYVQVPYENIKETLELTLPPLINTLKVGSNVDYSSMKRALP